MKTAYKKRRQEFADAVFLFLIFKERAYTPCYRKYIDIT